MRPHRHTVMAMGLLFFSGGGSFGGRSFFALPHRVAGWLGALKVANAC